MVGMIAAHAGMSERYILLEPKVIPPTPPSSAISLGYSSPNLPKVDAVHDQLSLLLLSRARFEMAVEVTDHVLRTDTYQSAAVRVSLIARSCISRPHRAHISPISRAYLAGEGGAWRSARGTRAA